MGFLGWVGDVADKFTSAIGIPWKPSSLISKAGDLLPVVADAVPGIGPILSEGLSAAQAIFGGNGTKGTSTTSTPTESVQANKSSPLDLSQMRETLSSTLSAINENRAVLKKRFDDEDAKLDKLTSRFGNINSDIATLQKRLEALQSAEHADEEKTEHQLNVLNLLMEKSILQTADLKWEIKSLKSTYTDQQKQQNRLDLMDKHDDLADLVHPAIEYLKDHLETFDKISLRDQDPSKILPYFNSSEGSSLPKHYSKLQGGISIIRSYIQREIPTQEVLDLYIFAVTWLLAYHKAIITLRSYLAYYYLESHQILDYTNTISQWNDELRDLVHDARENANFLLGKEKERKGRIDELAEMRLNLIRPREAYENDHLGHVTYFYDHYPSYGVGFKELDFTEDRGDRGTIVIKARRDNPKGLNSDVDALRAGYLGIQGSSFTTATTAAVEMAKVWRNSAELWETRMPFNPKNAGPEVKETLKINIALATAKKAQEGLGYRKGQYVAHGVSYVTSFGEGRITWANPTFIEKGRRFIELQLNSVEGVKDISLDFLPKDRPHPAAGAAIVRRVYARITGFGLEKEHVLHLADRPGLISESFTVLDEATGLYPKDDDDDDDE